MERLSLEAATILFLFKHYILYILYKSEFNAYSQTKDIRLSRMCVVTQAEQPNN